MQFPIISAKLPGMEHSQRSDSNYTASIDLNQAIDPHIPPSLHDELG